jgi:N-acetylglutamate synthase-like GNAT family acetyltransferase
MTEQSYDIKPARANDLQAINVVIENAVMGWPLAERVKRLSVNVLIYDVTDFSHYNMYVAYKNHEIVGVVAWDPQHPDNLLHGIYITPAEQQNGLGKQLLSFIFTLAKELAKTSVIIKAERISCAYFEHLGLEKVTSERLNNYPYLYRKVL